MSGWDRLKELQARPGTPRVLMAELAEFAVEEEDG